MFGVVPKAIWNRDRVAGRQNRIEMGLNCSLIRAGGKSVLVETSVGTKQSSQAKSIYHMRAGRLSLAPVDLPGQDDGEGKIR